MAEENDIQDGENQDPNEKGKVHDVIPVSGLYENWFLEYASYVIMERAVPQLEDGLKPVQRRILHSMKEMDDGRFNKVANIIGQTMQYHPHGDAAIGDAIVNMGQKDLLIDTQGNWGDVRTGDRAAAPRYIEARLTKFALDVVYNPQTTEWQLSYDGRKKEPVTLPVKFPLILAQGVEGIAVGLATKIMPHNFCELIQASIDVLKNKKINLYPDFPAGGMADFSNYNEGLRGGKIRVRSKVEVVDKKTLVIRDMPFGVTTSSLIDSVIKANDQGKIKIKQVVDNTAKDVEVMITLPNNVSPDMTVDALYAFTDCEVSISPNSCVIIDDKPQFVSVNELLKICTAKTIDLLTRELEIKRGELMEKILFSSLEKIFIENRIYRDIEECETWEAVLETIDKGLDPFKPQFYRDITQDDILRLTEIKIKRISKFDTFKADELMRNLQEELEKTEYNLENITDFAIDYFKNLLEKYGKGKERKTEIRTFDTIEANVVAVANQKLYVNRNDGFIGYGLKKDEYVCDCSDIDDIIVFRKDGYFQVVKVADKVFVGKDILYAGVFKKGDERMVYHMVYVDGKSGKSMIKRFQVLGVTREKEYDLTKGNKGSKVHYFSANPNGENEVITIYLTSGCNAKKKVFDFEVGELAIKGRGSQGNTLTKYPVRKIVQKEQGASTLGGLDIWLDESVGRLNRDERGIYLGNFDGEDQILVIYKDGSYELTNFELTNRYEVSQISLIEKFDPDGVISAIHFDPDQNTYYIKRFQIETSSQDKRFVFISENKGAKLEYVSTHPTPSVEITTKEKARGPKETQEIRLDEYIDVKGWKAIGNKLTSDKLVSIDDKSPEIKEEDEDDTSDSSEESQATKSEPEKKEEKETDDQSKDKKLDIGSSVEFKVKKKKDKGDDNEEKDQLGLF